MEEIDDIAPLVHYNMLLSSLPMDKRGHEDFGAYLRADENIVRRMLNALMIQLPDDFTYDNVVKILDHTGQVSGLSGDDLAPARGNMRKHAPRARHPQCASHAFHGQIPRRRWTDAPTRAG